MAERAAKQLELNKSELPNSITEVIATLSRAGFDAYIVGGGVRDTLLGLKPKDFDAVTDAKPHEIKDVFGKRCRIIGRRFQLAHVYSGRELIEVATFRGPPNNDANTNQDGMIIRDNVWGDIKQDFARRDFSINALYYQPLKGVVHDYCDALDDIRTKTIRLLGHAPVRIEEDPVRLLRALRFKAKLGFEFDEALSEQFHDGNWALLEQISPHRLYDETQKMFTGGYLVPLLPLLFESGAIDSLIIYPPAEPSALVQQVAVNTDKRIGAGKSINPAFFYAALLWENYLHQLEKAKQRNMPFAEAQMHAAGKVIDRQRIKTAIPKFAEQFIRDIWILQPKLAAPRSKQIEQLAEHPRFRAGFDFLLLREQCGDAEHPLSESTNDMGDWWQTYQTLSEKQKQQAIDDFDENLRRGAHKREKNGQRGRGRNRQNQTDNSDNKQVSQAENNAQANSRNLIEQPVINDASNIPTRRRRAASQKTSMDAVQVEQTSSRTTKPQQSRGSQIQNTQQIKQDGNELAQLQRLSLASANKPSNKRQSPRPAPLFVIEHENVVPPLQKQIGNDNVAPSSNSKAATQNKSTPRSKEKAIDTEPKVVSSTNKAQPAHDSAQTQQSIDKQSMPAQKKVKSAVIQAPQLVSNNSEPIPHKRRRRQPTVDTQVATDSSSASTQYEKTQYEKKSPKPVQQPKANAEDSVKNDSKTRATKPASSRSNSKSTKPARTTKAAKAKATDTKTEVHAKEATTQSSNTNRTSTNKGAVPSKRRRRQPSTDTTVVEQKGK